MRSPSRALHQWRNRDCRGNRTHQRRGAAPALKLSCVRQVGNVFQALAIDHNGQHVGRVGHAQRFDRGLQLIQGEVIHAINVPGAQSDRSKTAWRWFSRDDHDMRQTTLAVAYQIQRFGTGVLRSTGKRGYAVINQEGRGVDGAVVLSVAHHHDIRCDGVVAAESCRQFGIGLGGPVKRDQVSELEEGFTHETRADAFKLLARSLARDAFADGFSFEQIGNALGNRLASGVAAVGVAHHACAVGG
ncbi:hypothetical protein G6F64_013448 [Rhizopus arrhizus]|uniref:Uncharacterized protein n=1 Tax=Rhizopus oryzae TaxID=64495 RepID=A0A9P6WVX8_RHIOR|nr:hypothetical protein G6F64_013448 [Rhizopus arrhizus]